MLKTSNEALKRFRSSMQGGSFWMKLGAWTIFFMLGLALGWMATEYRKLEGDHARTTEALEAAQQENENLQLSLRDEVYARENLQGMIENFGNTLGLLEKLSKTDEELLRKYSKVYFLNENYVPQNLTEMDKEYAYNQSNKVLLNAEVWTYLERLLLEARREDIVLLVSSAYRSFQEQATLKSGYKVVYGSGANRFSADQGYSEHQLGTTVDFATRASGPASLSFETDKAYGWLKNNAHRFGFTLSYPKGNSYYIFEPWHWRFVGVELATKLHEEGKSFYNLDQREIDSYLVKLFD